MPTPGEYDPTTGAIWDGKEWVGGTKSRTSAPATPPAAAPTPAPAGQAPYDPKGTAGPIAGMTNIQVDSYRAQAKAALKQIGVLDYQPTNEELRSFFTSGFDAEAIANYYTTDPAMVARQPGLPFGVSRETYQQNLSGYQQAWKSAFAGTPFPEAPPSTAAPSDINRNLVGYAMKQNISPTQFGQSIEQFRQRRGKAPSQEEFASFQQERAQETPQAGGGGVAGGPRPARQETVRPTVIRR